MLLIATDEAGYGPKLGPLVVVATAWRIPDPPAGNHVGRDDLEKLFEPLRQPFCAEYGPVVVDDSKVVYQPGDGLERLHAVVSASLRWADCHCTGLRELLGVLVPDDAQSIQTVPWFRKLFDDGFASAKQAANLQSHWARAGIDLVGIRARVITAQKLNKYVEEGYNKADVLSESTLRLVHSLATTCESDGDVDVYCDRHGGRKFYASVLQHVFPDEQLSVASETKRNSRYKLVGTKRTIRGRL